MTSDGREKHVTHLLSRWGSGAAGADEALMESVYGELRRLAASYLRRERDGHTLQPTALVHEAYLRLMPQRSLPWKNRAHFFGIAASMMRRVLVDYARRRRANKRDGLVEAGVSISQVEAPAGEVDQIDVLLLDEALTALAALDPRQADIVQHRFFAGLTNEEVAGVMDLSPATIKREWATAKLWLRRRMQGG